MKRNSKQNLILNFFYVFQRERYGLFDPYDGQQLIWNRPATNGPVQCLICGQQSILYCMFVARDLRDSSLRKLTYADAASNLRNWALFFFVAFIIWFFVIFCHIRENQETKLYSQVQKLNKIIKKCDKNLIF